MDDLERNVWCLLGLPFDAVTMDETIAKIHHAVKTRKKYFISTPNLNFLIASQEDSVFRNSVINSDLSVADGKPLIWIAHLLNIPLPERVAGSDIIERLVENKEGNTPIKVFFFGGEEGIAKKACEKLNAQEKGLQCVGFYNPGFGSIEEMSTEVIIDNINQSGADFVIVSLGAKKGQMWIQANKDKLETPVISHLGAVVNFIAGTVQRAPKLMQKLGLEWIWRVKEEPTLWKRYSGDGMKFLKIAITKILPLLILSSLHRPSTTRGCTVIINSNDSAVINISGEIRNSDIKDIDNAIRAISNAETIVLDLTKVEYFEPTFLAYLQLLRYELKLKSCDLIVYAALNIRKKFIYHGCSYLLVKSNYFRN